jgi:N,N'-diacetyllegionaminate synthase
MPAIRVSNSLIGEGQPCFIVAEIGINHNGDINMAYKLIDAAIGCGVDAVKFQNYYTEDFIVDRSINYQYISQGKRVTESQYDMFKRYELSVDALTQIYAYCDERKIIFFSTPTSEQGVNDLWRLGVPLLKNGSDYLVHLPLLKAMGKTGLPTIISTGMATLAEIDDAVTTFQEAGGKDFILLHCTSSYPTSPEEVNLRKISSLAAAFACPVGFSDHTEGIIASIGATAMGACVIEKHFTLDKNLPGPDHTFSSNPEEFKALVDGLRTFEKNLGTSKLGPTLTEKTNRRDFRLSCVATRDLPAGHRLNNSDIGFRRPGIGFPPKSHELLVGRKLKNDVSNNQVFKAGDFL